MKLFKTCPILIFIAAIAIALSVTSYALEDTVYSDYTYDYQPDKAPHFIMVLKGLTDGVYPWSQVSALDDMGVLADGSGDTGAEADLGEDTANDSDNSETVEKVIAGENETLTRVSGVEEPADSISGNSVSGNSISGNSISGNDAEEVYEYTPVDEDYFCDALFIGDSRTVGLSEYCAPLDERATFYAKVSLTIYGAMDKPFVKTDAGEISVAKALEKKQFGKIYIMLGLNEMGTGTIETFTEEYANVIERIRELQPDAMIFIQGIMHVTEKKSKQDKYFNNKNINERNEALSQLADNKTIFYMDMNEAVDDENGNLLSELSFDDIHLKASSYERWYEFLLNHGIVKE
ncbi:MAG: acylhydrolase [Butyrivibrio sp.]|nr:acylhydrolase [Butyrivibrio sp.]